jgi:hypothetical protein
MKYKNKYHTVEIVPKYEEKQSWKEATSRSPTHKYDRALSWYGTGTSYDVHYQIMFLSFIRNPACVTSGAGTGTRAY